jgi:serine/threonine protein phosphatase PrpC
MTGGARNAGEGALSTDAGAMLTAPLLRAEQLRVGFSMRDLHMEDRTLISLGMRLFGVFDGVGAPGGGAEVAALAVQAVHDFVAGHLTPPTTVVGAQEMLAGALAAADTAIADHNRGRPGPPPSATTAAVLLIFRPPGLRPPDLVGVAATLGDSRVALVRGGELFVISLDHSYFNDDDPPEAKARQDRLDHVRRLDDLEDPLDRVAFMHRNLISAALNGDGHAEARFYALRLTPGDRLIVDSDGIHDNLDSSEILALLERRDSPQPTANALVDAAYARSNDDPGAEPRAKPDDISIIVIDILDPGAAS